VGGGRSWGADSITCSGDKKMAVWGEASLRGNREGERKMRNPANATASNGEKCLTRVRS